MKKFILLPTLLTYALNLYAQQIDSTLVRLSPGKEKLSSFIMQCEQDTVYFNKVIKEQTNFKLPLSFKDCDKLTVELSLKGKRYQINIENDGSYRAFYELQFYVEKGILNCRHPFTNEYAVAVGSLKAQESHKHEESKIRYCLDSISQENVQKAIDQFKAKHPEQECSFFFHCNSGRCIVQLVSMRFFQDDEILNHLIKANSRVLEVNEHVYPIFFKTDLDFYYPDAIQRTAVKGFIGADFILEGPDILIKPKYSH